MKPVEVIVLTALILFVIVMNIFYFRENNICRSQGGYYVQEYGKIGRTCIYP